MKIIFHAALGLFALTAQHAAAGAFYNGNKLFEECRKQDNFGSKGICLGYISGIADAMSASPEKYSTVINGKTTEQPRACFRGGVSGDQLRDIVMKYLDAYPQRRDYGAYGLVAEALSNAFPCQ